MGDLWVDEVVVVAREQQGHTNMENSKTKVDILRRSFTELLNTKGHHLNLGRHHLNRVAC